MLGQMNRYSITLYELMKNEDCMDAINKAMSTYPLYQKKSKEEYIPSIVPTREQLNAKILARYKYREIGFDTIGRFLDELEIALNEIMPYYNQLLFTVDQDYNILYNVDYTRDITTNRAGSEDVTNESQSTNDNEAEASNTQQSQSTDTQESQSNTTDSHESTQSMTNATKDIKSKTPQSELSISAENIDNVDYADDVEWNKANSNGNNTSNGTVSNTSGGTSQNTSSGSNQSNSTSKNTFTGTSNSNSTNTMDETTKERILGNYGQVSAQSLVDRYRDLIVNVEQKIIEDRRIAELFMLVY